MRRLWASLVLVGVLAVGCDRGSHPENLGKPAPQFVVGDETKTVDLSKLRGQGGGPEFVGQLVRSLY